MVGTTIGATVLAQDTFAGRSVATGWGIASDGNAWRVQAGNTGVLSVSGNEGRVDGSNSMALLVATLGTHTAADTDVVARYTSGTTPTMPATSCPASRAPAPTMRPAWTRRTVRRSSTS